MESIGRGVLPSGTEVIELVEIPMPDGARLELEGVPPERFPSTTVNLVATEEFPMGTPLASTTVTVTVWAPGVSPVKVYSSAVVLTGSLPSS